MKKKKKTISFALVVISKLTREIFGYMGIRNREKVSLAWDTAPLTDFRSANLLVLPLLRRV